MVVFKTLIIYLCSLIQTLLGFFIYDRVFFPEYKSTGIIGGYEKVSIWDSGFIAAIIVLALISLFVMWLRLGDLEYRSMLVVVEFILAPLAIFRVIFSIIHWIFSQDEPELDFTESASLADQILCYLIYSDEGLEADSSPVKTFFLQLIVVFPLSILLTFCSWRFINLLTGKIVNESGFFGTQFVALVGIIVSALLFVYVKSTKIETWYDVTYTNFHNSRTGRDVSVRGSGYAYYQGDGWFRGNVFTLAHLDSKIPHFVSHFILNILFSPILAYTQAFGILAAFVGIFTYHVRSSFGQMYYDDAPLPLLQMPLGYLCSFIII